MRTAPHYVLSIVIALAFAAPALWADEPSKAAQPPAKASTKAPAKTLPWISSLADGQRRAMVDRKPLLVRVIASWCVPCQKLGAEIEKPSVQSELSRWALVELDADHAGDEADELGVNGIPALRIRTMAGQTVASHDGFLTAEELVDWLKKNFEAATAEPDEALTGEGEPNAVAVVRLVKMFDERNPAIREAAIRRLEPHPQKALADVARVMAEGKLSSRLAALELLRAWNAPVGEIDPWQPESVTPARIAALNAWVEKYQPPQTPQTRKFSAADLAEAGRDIDRMLKANERDAEAIRDRLAAYGPALLPDVTARLKATSDDELRQRLWALRYRLVASDALALRWPGGLERLAASDPRHRQRAADELARLASASDQGLLVELFSDSDPIVREFSLRGLQNIGGRQSTAALLKLLNDPEPNVRAAVLKLLEEKPDATLVPKLADYLKTEKDADLLVHAIRFLRSAGGEAAAKSLIPLLHHETWQVRAEACDALGKLGENGNYRSSSFGTTFSSGNDSSDNLQAEIGAAMLDLLADSDPFVVSRVVENLNRIDLLIAVDPLVAAAEKHPELAAKIVERLASGDKMKVAALPHIRKFRKSSDPQVRIAAMTGLVAIRPEESDAELAAGMSDTSEKVRIAAAEICLKTMEEQRETFCRQLQNSNRNDYSVSAVEVAPPVTSSSGGGLLGAMLAALGGGSSKPAPAKNSTTPAKADTAAKPAQDKSAEEDNPYDAWLKEYYAGKHRPAWIAELSGPLEKMLASQSADERFAAAMALIPLGKADKALPLLEAMARNEPKKIHEVSEALPWLVWEQRAALFHRLRGQPKSGEYLPLLIAQLAQVREPRAADLFWQMSADPKINDAACEELEESLLSIYGISYWSSHRDTSQTNKASVATLAKAALARVDAGDDRQRLMALCILTYTDPDGAVALAEKMVADGRLSDDLRGDAFHVILATSSKSEATKVAVIALAERDAVRQKLALSFLVQGGDGLRQLRKKFMVQTDSDMSSRTSGVPIVPEAPPGVKAADLLPLLDDADPEVAAEAGYLLALLGEPRGLEPVLRRLNDAEADSSNWQRLAYRAIAALDDPSQLPVLRKIYAGLQQYYVSEFYWTIRSMTGPEILKFRKQIRDEVGISQLQ